MGKFNHQIRWDITRSVTLASLFYFLHHAAKACLYPFLTLYFQKLGLTATQTGIVTGSKAVVWLFAAPLWTVSSKRWGKTKIILGLAMLSSISSNLSLTLVTPVDQENLVKDCFASLTPSTSQDGKSHIRTSLTSFSMSTILAEKATSLDKLNYSTVSPSFLNQLSTASINHKQIVDDLKHLQNFSIFVNNKTFSTTKITPVLTSSSIATTTTTKKTTTTTATTSTKLPTITSIKSTTSTKQHPITLEKPSQMAVILLPRIMAADPQSRSDIEDLLSEYDETRNWPRWKLRILTRKIVDLLDQQPDEDDVISTTATPTTSNDKVQELARYLLPFYQKQKSHDPSLSLSDFLYTYPRLQIVSQETRDEIEQYMLLLMKNDQTRSRRDLETNQRPNNFTNQTFSQRLEEDIKNSTRQLLDKVKSGLMDNVYTFIMVLLIVLVGELFAAPIDLLSDNSFYELLDELDSLNRYGRHKIVALIGAMLAGISVAAAVYFSPCYLAGNITRFNLHFYVFATLAGLAFLVVPFYPMYIQRSNQAKKSQSVTICPCCHVRLCADCRRLLLVLTIVLVGIMQAGIQDFLLWQVQTLPNASELVYGSYVSANAFTSLLAIPIGTKLTSFIRSGYSIPISLIVFAVQLLLCSFINNAWYIVPLQLLNVIGVSFLWMVIGSELKSMMAWSDERTSLRVLDQVHVFAKSSQRRSTYIGLLCLYQGLAFSLGSVISGIAYDAAGRSLIPFLRVGAVVVGGWAFCYLFFHCCCIKKTSSRKYSKLLDDGSGDEVETFNLRGGNPDIGFSKKKSQNYLENGRKVAESRKKRRNRQAYDMTSSTDDELERDWLAMNVRRDDRM